MTCSPSYEETVAELTPGLSSTPRPTVHFSSVQRGAHLRGRTHRQSNRALVRVSLLDNYKFNVNRERGHTGLKRLISNVEAFLYVFQAGSREPARPNEQQAMNVDPLREGAARLPQTLRHTHHGMDLRQCENHEPSSHTARSSLSGEGSLTTERTWLWS